MLIWRKKINGKIYDKTILDIAEKSVAKGSGINLNTAKKIFELLYYTYGDYPDISKDTVKYLRHKYKWDTIADKWFREEIRRWAAEKSMKKKKPSKK